MLICKVCGNKNNNKVFEAKEMMFGTNEIFDYFECARCGSLQIIKIPKDINNYYPDNYCDSFYRKIPKIKNNFWKSLAHKLLARLYLKNIPLPDFLEKRQPEFFLWLKKTSVNQNSKILDVGCGNGELLSELKRYGFDNLLGLDPYLPKTMVNSGGVKIIKANLSDIKGKFDLIIMHHSFEHMANPKKILLEINKLLKSKGEVLIRMPLAAYAWKKYRTNWVQLDAPRHYFLPTAKGLKILIERSGFNLKSITFDSTELQFLGSEQYRRGVAFFGSKSYIKNKGVFSAKKIIKFKKRAKELNEKKQGDSVFFVLKNK